MSRTATYIYLSVYSIVGVHCLGPKIIKLVDLARGNSGSQPSTTSPRQTILWWTLFCCLRCRCCRHSFMEYSVQERQQIGIQYWPIVFVATADTSQGLASDTGVSSRGHSGAAVPCPLQQNGTHWWVWVTPPRGASEQISPRPRDQCGWCVKPSYGSMGPLGEKGKTRVGGRPHYSLGSSSSRRTGRTGNSEIKKKKGKRRRRWCHRRSSLERRRWKTACIQHAFDQCCSYTNIDKNRRRTILLNCSSTCRVSVIWAILPCACGPFSLPGPKTTPNNL